MRHCSKRNELVGPFSRVENPHAQHRIHVYSPRSSKWSIVDLRTVFSLVQRAAILGARQKNYSHTKHANWRQFVQNQCSFLPSLSLSTLMSHKLTAATYTLYMRMRIILPPYAYNIYLPLIRWY